MHITLVTAVLLGVLALATGGTVQLTWRLTNNRTAVCNDFTRAGFFHRNVPVSGTEQKWVIFLESGSLCYSNETCNRRYFQKRIRDRYSTSIAGEALFGDFDTGSVWERTGAAGQPLAEVVNPLMTSVYCFTNETTYFRSDGRDITIEGRDILSTDCTENPTFCNHGHVLVPYCSSDMWLGTENETSRQYSSLLKEEPCDCWDQDCFRYNPTSDDLQFTFRGQTIFRSVLQTLDSMYNLHEASEIVLVGSSAGGVGVLNSAKWMREEYWNVSIKVIADSSWFINFRDSIDQEFRKLLSVVKSTSLSVFEVLDSNEVCGDTRLGYPCCVSAQCLLQESSMLTGEPYFPRDVSLFSLTSVYDVFLLANALAGLVHLQNSGISSTGLALQFLMTIGEYGGAMNSSLVETAIAASQSNVKFTYFAPQCFQHIYFVTSTLGEEDGLLGTEAIEISQAVATFRHRVQSGVWSSHVLAYYEGQGYTIRDAIHYWYWNVSDTEEGVAFRDVCSGPHCSSTCPEEFILEGEDVAGGWSTGAKISIAVIVLTIAVICLLMKLYCCVWLNSLHRSQKRFLSSRESNLIEEIPVMKRMLPPCTDDEAISVACLDLHYHVTVHMNIRHIKPEKKGRVSSFIDVPEEGDNEDVTDRTDVEGDIPSERDKIREVALGKKKKILNGISAYFNPSELIAIMGPSGCGKTTFLDLLTGRRKTDNTLGKVFVNGFPIEESRKWYINNTGYVLQLAAPYYEELTVRENLTLAAWVKLHISSREKFQRVEQMMEVTALMDLADTIVGGATGPGLSGGQKRRLVVALQLLKLPSVIFLDEPTSGLDSASATELLTQLNTLAGSNRTVVLTIHQPRLEIFHMFHRVIVLTGGKVAYQGVPEKAYEVFVKALHSSCLRQGFDIPPLEDHNPADVIMEMLGDQKMGKIVNDYYEDSGEPELVRKAVAEAWELERGRLYSDQIDGTGTLSAKLKTMRVIVQGNRQAGRAHNYSIIRLAALEARAMKRSNLITMLYLPVIFFGYGFLLGTVYFQTTVPFLVMSGFCVYSVASALFMFPALYTFYTRAMEIYTFEHADGAGRATDLVIQPFVRFISMAFFPVIICAGVLYILLVDKLRWNLLEFIQIALVNLALNQVWTALLIWLILTFPQKAFRLSPVISALAGFTSGFFIPINDIPLWYRWLCYINPNYYGFSASAVILLTDFESDCEMDGGSELECYSSSGKYILDVFNFANINPYQNIVILLGMTTFFLIMAVLSNWVRYTAPKQVKEKFKKIFKKTFVWTTPTEPVFSQLKNIRRVDSDEEVLSAERAVRYKEPEKEDEQVSDEAVEQESRALPTMGDTLLRPKQKTESIKAKRDKRKALYLDAGQAHIVWKPKRQESKKNIQLTDSENRQDLLERQQKLQSRIMATQKVLKDHRELAIVSDEDEEEGIEVYEPMFKEQLKTKKDVTKDNAKAKRKKRSKRSVHFHETVSEYVQTMSPPKNNGAAKPTVPGFRQWKSQFMEGNKETDTWKRCFSESSIPKSGNDQSAKSDAKVKSAESKF